MPNKTLTIALIGRRNVGKSALFNRLIEEAKAIVSSVAGTTRDRTEGLCFWRGQTLKIVDTGGLDGEKESLIEKEVVKQAEWAAEKSDLILFLVDLKTGLLPQEIAIFQKLQPLRSKIIFVGNKADGEKIRLASFEKEWLKFGLGAPLPISALTGAGVGDLLDEIFKKLHLRTKKAKAAERGQSSTGEVWPQRAATKESPFKIAIAGLPNVGKSQLLNRLVGEKRVIVSPLPHTTREPQDTELIFQNKKIILIDTAGIRRKNKLPSLAMEKQGIERSLEVFKKADLVFFVLEPITHFSHQDRELADLLAESSASVMILVNKSDTLEKHEGVQEKIISAIRNQMPRLSFAPIAFISALTGLNAQKLLPLALELAKERARIVAPEELKEILPRLILRHKPARGKTGHHLIKKIEQSDSNPPQFTIWIGQKQSLHFSYVHFLENRLREHFGFNGAPIKIWVRQEGM